MNLALELDLIAARAWPAEDTQWAGSCLLRATGGYTDRANSVAVLGEHDHDRMPPDTIPTAERFYAERSLPTKFQLSEVDSTPELRSALERRGYTADKPTWVRVADIAAAAEAGPQRKVNLASAPTDAWFDLWWSIDGRGDKHRGAARELLQRMPAATTFASVTNDDGEVLAVALGVLDSGWLGLFCAATDPQARGQQLAGSITAALATWGADNGATRAYCQVAAGNDASLRMTDRASFTNAYQYRYFVQQQTTT